MDNIDQVSEQVELETLKSLHACCPDETRKALGLDLVEIADGIAACCTTDSSILLNRILGLGTQEPVTDESIYKVQELYRLKNIENYFLHLYDNTLTDQARSLIQGPLFEQRRGWMKFRSITPAKCQPETSLHIEKVSLNKSTDFGTIVCRAFGMQETSIPLLSSLANDDRWHLFVSYDGDHPAGAGSLFIDQGMGWLEWGATDPAYRCRGSQSAIMAARLNLAADMGCQYVFTETGEEVEGDPQHSYKNIQKSGFEESILRLNFAPAK